MSKWINLDDPEVHYLHNYGTAEAYVVGGNVERIDIVRCEECGYWQQVDSEFGRCSGGYMNKDMRTGKTWFCAGRVRRADDE